MRAGELQHLVPVKRRSAGEDEAGQPLDIWEDVGNLWVGIANETGMGAIRASLQGGVPASIARYSFLARFDAVQEMAVDAGMRIEHEGLLFDIKGVVRDLQDREKAYILTEQGGNAG